MSLGHIILRGKKNLKRYSASATPVESQRTQHFPNAEHPEGWCFSGWLHDSFSSWTHVYGLYLVPKATAGSQSGVISEPLKVCIVSRTYVTHISELRQPGNALPTLMSHSHNCPAVPHVNWDYLGKWKEWARQSRMSSDSDVRQLALSISLYASVVPNWFGMS